MSAKRFFLVMLGIIVLLGIGIIASAVLGDKLLEKQASKIVTLKTDNQVLDAEQLSLAQAKKDVQKYSELQTEAQSIVPQDKNQAEAVREIINIASNTNIKIASVTFPASALGGVLSAAGKLSSPTTPSSLTQVQPVSGISGVYALPITIQNDANSSISYDSFINFLSQLEQNRRTSQVTSVTLQPTAINSNQLTFNLVVDVYLKP